MSEKSALRIDDLPLTDELVVAYLQDNPDFFKRQPELLTSLRFVDPQRGVVSLVERQQRQLRDKVQLLEEEITQLMTVANYNEQLFVVYNDLYLRLIDCQSAEEILTCLQQATTELLSLADFKIWLAQGNPFSHDSLLPSDAEQVLQSKLASDDFYFGRLQQSEQKLLFTDSQPGSVVLIKLEHQQQLIGFIAISSQDAEHFDPRMDTLLLGQFRRLVAKLLSQWLEDN